MLQHRQRVWVVTHCVPVDGLARCLDGHVTRDAARIPNLACTGETSVGLQARPDVIP